MPRIRCSVRRYMREKSFPFVTFFLRAPRIARPMDGLIDTGSPFTVLSTNDIMSTRLPITRMRSGEPVSLAGHRFFNHPIKNATMNFRTERGELFKVTLPAIGSLIPTKFDKKTMDDVKHIPSLIGNDFLEEQKLALYFNPSIRVAYLEY